MKEQNKTPTLVPTQTNSGIGELEQIEEIAKVLYDSDNKMNILICGIEALAEDIYNAGYRKQSDGKWEHINGNEHLCKNCSTTFYGFVDDFNFCPFCGARMKGGAE